jgi:hypothetical protein
MQGKIHVIQLSQNPSDARLSQVQTRRILVVGNGVA